MFFFFISYYMYRIEHQKKLFPPKEPFVSKKTKIFLNSFTFTLAQQDSVCKSPKTTLKQSCTSALSYN